MYGIHEWYNFHGLVNVGKSIYQCHGWILGYVGYTPPPIYSDTPGAGWGDGVISNISRNPHPWDEQRYILPTWKPMKIQPIHVGNSHHFPPFLAWVPQARLSSWTQPPELSPRSWLMAKSWLGARRSMVPRSGIFRNDIFWWQKKGCEIRCQQNHDA